MFEFLKKQTCSQCGTDFRGKALSFPIPNSRDTRPVCGPACMEAAYAELKAKRDVVHARVDAEAAAFRETLVAAYERGDIVNLTAEAGQPRVGVLGGPPCGLSRDDWPRTQQGPMLHVASIDLAPLRAGDGGLGVYVEAFRDDDGWSCGGEVRTIQLANIDTDASVRDAHASRFPIELLSPVPLSISDRPPSFETTGAAVPSYAGGRPSTFEGRPYETDPRDGAFIAQLAGNSFDVGEELEGLFGEIAALYVFEHGAHLASYG